MKIINERFQPQVNYFSHFEDDRTGKPTIHVSEIKLDI